MNNSDDLDQIRRLLSGVILLLIVLNLLVAAGLYLQFAPRLDVTLDGWPTIVLIVGCALAVIVAGVESIRSLVSSPPRR